MAINHCDIDDIEDENSCTTIIPILNMKTACLIRFTIVVAIIVNDIEAPLINMKVMFTILTIRIVTIMRMLRMRL